MLDANGNNTQLSLDDARTLVLAAAAAAGVDVISGSVEDQLKEWMAQGLVDFDSFSYESVVRQFFPTGSDIDLQNPGFPRLQPTVSGGFLKVDNSGGGSPLSIPEGTEYTAPNGNIYDSTTLALTVAAGEIGYVSIESQETGAAQNLPKGQTFTGGPGGVVTNPQPITGGQDLETDSNYLNRLIYLRTNVTSQQASSVLIQEMLESYQAATIYINSSNNGTTIPIPVPAQGANVIVLFDSGTSAGSEETANAISILVNRLEFITLNSQVSDLHPIIQGTSFATVVPRTYSITVAQSVDSTIDVELSVQFPESTVAEEKLALVEDFAIQFVQRIIGLLSGSAGSFHMTFNPADDDPVVEDLEVVASTTGPVLAPFVSIEAIRSLLPDPSPSGAGSILRLISTDALTIEFDPDEAGESPVEMSIAAPAGGTVATVDFIHDALFSDDTSWYDRYLSLDPDLISVTITEISEES